MLKKLIVRLLFRLLDSSFKTDYSKINKEKMEEWAFYSFDHPGWRSYFAYEDLKILKELSFGKTPDQYMMLVGRRIQLLYMFDEMRKSFEMRKTAQEKKISESEKK